jgi:signal transduction histidine kinase/ABC-type sugar transport system substrate-binding protein/AraC-like DNA-binding protein
VTGEPINHFRIGVEIGPYDPYWVEVREVVCQRVRDAGMELVRLEIADSNTTFTSMSPAALVDELLALKLDAFIVVNLPVNVTAKLLENGLPVISTSESRIRHKFFTCPGDLYEAANLAGKFIVEKTGGHGRVVVAGGIIDVGEDRGESRYKGFQDAIQGCPDISVHYAPCFWDYERAYGQIKSAIKEIDGPIDAGFGLSDSLALGIYESLKELGRSNSDLVLVGINADPLALAAIVNGKMSATVETSAEKMGEQVVEMAIRGAQRKVLPPKYFLTPRLITRENVADVAVEKLLAIAHIPTLMVGLNRQEQQNRLRQLETSSAINQRMGSLLDRRCLSQEIAEVIRANYGFDMVQVYLWSKEDQAFNLENCEYGSTPEHIHLDQPGLLGEAIRSGEPILIPDTLQSQRYPPDTRYPRTHSRIVLPIRLGKLTNGLLDLHRKRTSQHLRQELIGLQTLADHFSIAMRNAELFSEALKAREEAERANQLKTRLLANVSHELRTPLNVILGYSQAALQSPNPYKIQLPPELIRDLGYIYQSGEHLIRIINDLLDVSRAEIGELELYPETIRTRSFLIEIFHSFTRSQGRSSGAKVTWKLQIPQALPVIMADPVRLRQILLNLLSNGAKYTTCGQVTLGAEVDPPYLHFWVKDTGSGIPVDQQERIFEPFVTLEQNSRRREGIGLGLSITRRLISLHNGSLTLDSQPGQGSTFHFYLPLPNFSNQPHLSLTGGEKYAMVVISSQGNISKEIQSIASHQGLDLLVVQNLHDLEKISGRGQPIVMAWDMSSASAAEWQIVQQIQSQPQFGQLPLILYKYEEEGVQGQQTGMTNILTKPFNHKTLSGFLKSIYDANTKGIVLIADDDPQARDLYTQVVCEALPGYAIRAVENGTKLLHALELETPALILLDLMMPEIDGFAILEMLRGDPRTAHLPVIVITGKKLSLNDIQRLDFARVTLHSKELLSPDETVDLLRKTLNGENGLSQPTSRLVKYALVYIHENYAQPLTRKELAEKVGVSENYLSQIFHQELGVSPWETVTRLRIQKAKELLVENGDTITRVAMQVGFNDSAYFSRVFRKMAGVSPQEFRAKSGI